jgi:outer membrane protein
MALERQGRHSHAGAWEREILLLVILLFSCTLHAAEDLVTIYRQAVAEDPSLESAQEALLAVSETHKQANAALYLPQASLNANLNQHFQNIQLSGDSTGLSGQSNFTSGDYTLMITQPLLHYDRLVALDQADTRIAQAEASYSAAESNLLLRVAERYFDVLAAEDNRRFALARQQSLERALTETRQRQAVGFLALTDVQEAEAGADRATADSLQAEHQLRDSRESLREVTGRGYEHLAALREDFPLVPPDPQQEQRWIEQAVTQNLSVIAAERLSKTAEAEIRRQWAGHLPSVDVVGSHGFSTSGGRFGSADIRDSVIGLSLNVPLYQGAQVNAKIREAEHRHQQALADLKLAQRAARHNASRAFLGVVAGIRQVQALRQSLRSSETALTATQAGFQAGRRTTLDILIAERELLRIQRDYARARYDYVLNSLRLKQAIGALAPKDLEQINHWLVRQDPADSPKQ